MSLDGLDRLLLNLRSERERQSRAVALASREIASVIENHAKTHTGDTLRAGRFIYKPGMKVRKKVRVKSTTAPGGYVYPAGTSKVWRPAGRGWGDVTGLTRKSLKARVRASGRHGVDIVLSANTPYAPALELGYNSKWAWMKNAVVRNRGKIVGILNRRLAAR
jgi:DNA-binding protein H-NS